MSTRFVSWLAIAIAAAFLVVSSVAFSLSTVAWLAFAISCGTLLVSGAVAYGYRHDRASLLTTCLVAAISAWTVVASLVFPYATVQNLALASALAIGGLAVVGLAEHEVSVERAVHSLDENASKSNSRLAAAA
jgi:hypothetical protein